MQLISVLADVLFMALNLTFQIDYVHFQRPHMRIVVHIADRH